MPRTSDITPVQNNILDALKAYSTQSFPVCLKNYLRTHLRNMNDKTAGPAELSAKMITCFLTYHRLSGLLVGNTLSPPGEDLKPILS